ncbi:hypothetical protein IPA_03790 [Ignicoccus pacificus DSM 13166]|uniref:ATPase AAA-type core domain-containing protein n=1 Tax=Ignicoccus pacificus DSM 13166 TaxID=940294 RepID=A0A977PK16_9CREN|nr:hypothetical protein IPA_03790 [Ignicoccus pacificus DSM 13166]
MLKELWGSGVGIREEIEKIVKSFINMARISEETVSAFVIGEWGEGKTSIFDGYVKNLAKDFALYSVSARRLVDAVRLMRSSAGQSAAATFIAALLHSLAMEYEERGQRLIAPYSGESVHEYAKRALDELIEKSGDKKIIIFIDEFEEIVSPRNKDVVSEVLNGLVELINGEFGYLTSRYPGYLHLMIAMTPYAYNKALTLANIDESLKGRTERRLHFKIELRPLTRSEAYKLVGSIFKYAYGEEYSPVPSPFVNTIYAISQGNPGALTSLTNVVISSLVEDGCTIKVTDPTKLLSILSNTTVFTYVGSSKAFDKVYYDKVLLPLAKNDEEEKVISAIVAYYYPLTKKEIAELAGVKNEELVEVLDQRAAMTSVPLLYKVWRTSDYQKAFLALLEALRNVFPEADETELKKVIEELTYPKDLWSKEYYLIIPDESSSELLEDVISERRAVASVSRLASFLKKKVEEEGVRFEEAYMLSKKHAVNLFPPPAVAAVSFIKDPQLRAKAWKEALSAITKGDIDLDKVFAELIAVTMDGKILGKMVSVKVPVEGKLVNVNVYPKVLLYPDPSIRKVAEKAKREGAHVFLVLTKSDLAKKIEEMLGASPIDYFVIGTKDVKLVQLAVYSMYSTPERRSMLDLERAQMTLKDLGIELNIKGVLESWTRNAYEKGIIVDDVPRISGASEDAIAEAYTFYLAYPKEVMTTEDVFAHVVKKVRKFMIYGRGSRKRTPFATGLDIESVSALRRFEDDLIATGLLKRLDDEKLKLTMSKVERRILELLRDKGKSFWKNIEKEFIIMANNKRVLQDFYLKVLERRGLIRVERKGNEPYLVELVEPSSLVSTLEKEVSSVQETWRKNGYKWSTYAHLVVSKKKEDNLILLDEVKDYLESGARELRGETNALTVARRSMFLINLARYLKHQLVPVTVKAYEEGGKLIEKNEERLNEFESRLKDVANKALVIAKVPSVNPEEFDEVRELYSLINKMNEIDMKSFSKNELKEMISKMRAEEILPDLFYFEKFYDQRSWASADYFNLKYHSLREVSDTFAKKLRVYEGYVNEASRILKNIESKEKEILKRLEEIAKEGYNTKISSKAYEWIKELATAKGRGPEGVAVSLRSLIEVLRDTERSMGMFDEKILNAFHYLDKVKDKELMLVQNTAYLRMWIKFFQKFYQGTPFVKRAEEAEVALNKVMKTYENVAEEMREPSSTPELINILNESLRKLGELIGNVESVKKELEGFHKQKMNELMEELNSIKKSISILRKLSKEVEVPKSLLDVEFKLRKAIERAPTLIDDSITYLSLTRGLDGIRAYVRVMMRNMLNSTEEKVLEMLSKRSKWTLEEVVKEAERAGMSTEEVMKAILSLSEKGLLESVVRLK